ncbi:MAG: hypothetical protein IT174_15935 [Acidobacteria bacterium]|nr:hypothetical protein [Acidobacteriota bacterium]
MQIPNAELAIIDIGKLAAYSLDPTHEVGQHKAAVFERVLGLRAEDWRELYDALMYAVRNSQATPGRSDKFGQRYVIDFKMSRGKFSAAIRSVWIVDTGRDHPRLITCYVL